MSKSSGKSGKQAEFRIAPCALPGVQAVEATSSHVFSRHSHEEFGVGLILQGGHRSASGRGTVEALAGDLITVNPGEVHDGAPLGGMARSWRMLYLPPALADALAQDASEGRSREYCFQDPVARHPALAAAFARLYAAATAGRDAEGAGDGAALLREQLLLELLHGLGGQGAAPAGGAASAAVARARSRIDDAPAAALSLSELAQVSGLSRFHLLRQFSQATGLTPHAYLLLRRIQAARRLIAGGTPLAQAALDCGFADQSHMTRIFVRAYGLTPGAWLAARG